MITRPSPVATAPAEGRRRLLDNPRILALIALVLLALMAGLFWLAGRTSEIALPILADVLLYPLLAVDLALLAALGFVLARNLLKLWVEQRQAAPFARFRAKLVAALLAMTIVPSVLVLISGSEIIRNSAERWFSEPVDEVLGSAQTIATSWSHCCPTITSCGTANGLNRTGSTSRRNPTGASATFTFPIPVSTAKMTCSVNSMAR